MAMSGICFSPESGARHGSLAHARWSGQQDAARRRESYLLVDFVAQ